MSTEDVKLNGCSKENEAVTDESIKIIEIADTPKLLKQHVRHIVHEYLAMRKKCTKWVPGELTMN